MGLPAEKRPPRAMYADLAAVPPGKVAELIGGMLHVLPRPAPKHTNAASALGGELFGPFQRGRGGPGGWWVLDEPELHFAGPGGAEDVDVLVPDLAGWRRERLPSLPEQAHFTLVPDWICEVLSPSTEATDRGEKMPIYAREGVRTAWLVDPVARTLEVYVAEGTRGGRHAKTHAGAERVRVAPFEAIELDLSALWAG